MRKLVLGVALASTAMATPALARNDAWYVEANAGAMTVENIENLTGSGQVGVMDTRTGYDFGGIVGYDFGGFRLESEVSYRRAEEKTYDTGALVLPDSQFGGGAEALSFMVNGLLDFGPDDGLQGFVGGGVGVSRAKIAVISRFAPSNISDSDTGFAWQALAGVRAPLSSAVDVGLRYRFFNQDHIDLVNASSTNVRTRIRSHSLMGTLTYNFGGAAPVEEAAPPPPPPPPPPPRRPRRPRRRQWSATRVRTSCSSTGISRTSRRKLRPSSTTQSPPMATATACRSCLPVTLTVRVRPSTTRAFRNVATRRYVRT